MTAQDRHWHTIPDLDLVRLAESLDDDTREAAENEQMRRKAGRSGATMKLEPRRDVE